MQVCSETCEYLYLSATDFREKFYNQNESLKAALDKRLKERKKFQKDLTKQKTEFLVQNRAATKDFNKNEAKVDQNELYAMYVKVHDDKEESSDEMPQKREDANHSHCDEEVKVIEKQPKQILTVRRQIVNLNGVDELRTSHNPTYY